MSKYFLRACERLHGKTYYLFVCIRTCFFGTVIFDTNNNMKRINFSRRFDKPDLNFQKVYTHRQRKLRSYSKKIITDVRTALSYISQHSKKPVKYYKKLSYRRGTARCVVPFEILSDAQLPRNSAETTCTTSHEQIEVMKMEGYSGPMCNKHVHSTMTRSSRFHCLAGVINKPTT